MRCRRPRRVRRGGMKRSCRLPRLISLSCLRRRRRRLFLLIRSLSRRRPFNLNLSMRRRIIRALRRTLNSSRTRSRPRTGHRMYISTRRRWHDELPFPSPVVASSKNGLDALPYPSPVLRCRSLFIPFASDSFTTTTTSSPLLPNALFIITFVCPITWFCCIT